MPGQTAGLGTTSAVSASAADHTAQKTLTGIGITECPMDKRFNLQIRFFMYLPDLRKGQLSRCHHPGDTKSFQNGCPVRTLVRHLRAGMEIQIRKLTLQITKHTKILNNGCIQSVFIERSQKIVEFFHLLFLQKRVYRHI